MWTFPDIFNLEFKLRDYSHADFVYSTLLLLVDYGQNNPNISIKIIMIKVMSTNNSKWKFYLLIFPFALNIWSAATFYITTNELNSG